MHTYHEVQLSDLESVLAYVPAELLVKAKVKVRQK